MVAALGVGRWFVLGASALLFFLAATIPDDTGVRLLLVGIGVLFAWWGLAAQWVHSRTRRIRRSGIRAVGLVASMRQTGLVVNEVNPEIEFDVAVHRTDGVPPYAAKVRNVVPVIELAKLQAGMWLPLRVDPRLASRVVVAPDDGGVMPPPPSGDPAHAAAIEELRRQGLAIPSVSAEELARELDADRAMVAARGRAGTAIVRGVRDLGVTIAGRRALDVDLEIVPDDGGAAYRSPGAAAIPLEQVLRVREDARIRVRIHPEDRDQIAFQWDEPTTA